MRALARVGLSLVGVLAADILVSCLVQLVVAIRGGNAGSPWYSFFLVSLLSLAIVIPAWLCWLPVIWAFKNPIEIRRSLFIAIGVLWGPAFTYLIRLGSILRHPALSLVPTLFDGVAIAVSSFSTLFYLSLLKHSSSRRIQTD